MRRTRLNPEEITVQSFGTTERVGSAKGTGELHYHMNPDPTVTYKYDETCGTPCYTVYGGWGQTCQADTCTG
jgi:hypothetical protein